ncbi:MAG: alpha/beta hydrolase [Actinomycetota bacterium]|nr:alpha/beta hydrolase [Actinomycetota bacterium]
MKSSLVEVDGKQFDLVTEGEGPLILFLHGFPEGWYSWRSQLEYFSQRGYTVAAFNQRGYGRSFSPKEVSSYNSLSLAGDAIAVAASIKEGPFLLVGHDWGAALAWNIAIFRPDLVRAVAGLSVPFRPRTATPPLERIRTMAGENFYQIYFQEVGKAEADFEDDIAASLKAMYLGISHDAIRLVGKTWSMAKRGNEPLMSTAPNIDITSSTWLTQHDLDHFVEQFTASGFFGPLSWYRNFDYNWELTAPFARAKVLPPSMFLAGASDPVTHFMGVVESIPTMNSYMPNLKRVEIVEDAGHWIQQEKPDFVNSALEEFFAKI